MIPRCIKPLIFTRTDLISHFQPHRILLISTPIQPYIPFSFPSPTRPMSTATSTSSNLLMIPGPTEYYSQVLSKLGEPSLSHVSPGFINEFGTALENFRKLVLSRDGQPIILSGSGSLGWDVIVANLLERDDHALVVNTGYFSDSFADCCEAYGVNVTQVKAPSIGDTVSTDAIVSALKANSSIKMVCLTQVDTSTAVLNDIASMARAIRTASPNILIAVDGVCSFGAEEFRFDEWGIDAAMTCSQKGIATPPGLALILLSQRALSTFTSRRSKVPAYFASLHNWLPIMQSYEKRQPSYFATPNVNLVRALNVALEILLEHGTDTLVARHRHASGAFKAAMTALGIRFVPTSSSHAANTLTAMYYPEGIKGTELLPKLVANGVIVAGGLHKIIKAEYFRVGHMGVSVLDSSRSDVLRVVEAIEKSLSAVGYQFEAGAGVRAFQQYKA